MEPCEVVPSLRAGWKESRANAGRENRNRCLPPLKTINSTTFSFSRRSRRETDRPADSKCRPPETPTQRKTRVYLLTCTIDLFLSSHNLLFKANTTSSPPLPSYINSIRTECLLGNVVSLHRGLRHIFVHGLDDEHAKQRDDEKNGVDGVSGLEKGGVAGLVNLTTNGTT